MQHIPNLIDARKRLDQFIKNLPSSEILILYFTTNKTNNGIELVPSKRENFKKYISYYIYPGTSGWCYIYKDIHLKELIDIDDSGNILGFSKQQNYSELIGGNPLNRTTTEAIIGNHFTLGLDPTERNTKILLRTHKTEYYQVDTSEFLFRKHSEECNIVLKNLIDINTTMCENKMKDQSILTRYNNEPDVSILSELINEIIIKGNLGGCKEYSNYKGKRYLIKIGNKGGKYIELQQNTTRLYISKKQKGGNNITFSPEFQAFLSTYIFNPVKQNRQDLQRIKLIYGNKKYITVIYSFSDPIESVQIFYIDAHKAYDAFIDNISTSTKIIFNEFINSILHDKIIPAIQVY